MHRLFPCFFFTFLMSILSGSTGAAAPANSLLTNVKNESSLLFKTTMSKNGRLPKTELHIPWDKPSFQFWHSYYENNRWNRKKITSCLENFKVLYPSIKKIFKKEGVPVDLVFLAIVESNGDPSAVSKVGAAGLWQLMPDTARRLGLKVNWYVDERFDIEKSTLAAAKYLRYLYSLFGRWDLAIAAYNAGPATIFRRLKVLGTGRFWDLTKLSDETLNYVPKFYAILSFIRERKLFRNGKNWVSIVKIKVLSPTSLYKISKKLKVPYYIVKKFNNQYRIREVPRGCYVYMPADFIKRMSILKYVDSSKLYVYVPRRSERITTIARHFGVDARVIKEINRLRRTVVYKGQPVLIVKRECRREEVADGKS